MLIGVALVGKESGQTTWAKITWLRLSSNLCAGMEEVQGDRKRPSLGICVCARVTPYTPPKNKRKWMRILLIFLTMEGARLAKSGMPCPFVCLFCFKQATVIAKSWPGVESEINHALKLFY